MVELVERALALSEDSASVLAGIFLIGLAVIVFKVAFESEEVEEISRSERIRRARKLADEGLETEEERLGRRED